MKWKIPLSDLCYDERELDAVSAVIKSKWLTMGERTAEFEAKFAQYTGARHAIAVTNCTAALELSHITLGLTDNDEVIVPSLTFVATANSVITSGGKCVFADIESEQNWLLSASTIEPMISPKTRGVVVVHYAGYPADMPEISELCRKKRIYLIEDCAHSPGAAIAGKHTGTFGHFGCFSFFSNKNLSTGEGGMLITNDDALAEKARRLRSHGMTTLTWQRHQGHAFNYDVTDSGFNYRFDEIRAALGLVQLAKLDEMNVMRQRLAGNYIERLKSCPDIIVPFLDHGGNSSYHIFPILLPDGTDRTNIMRLMKEKGIQTSIHYPAVHLFSKMKQLYNTSEGLLKHTEKVANNVLTLPLFPGMTNDMVDYVTDCLIQYAKI